MRALRRSRVAELLYSGPTLSRTEERAFRRWAREQTTRFAITLLPFTASLVLLWWPTDALVFEGNRAAQQLAGAWRVAYAALAGMGVIACHKIRQRNGSPYVTLTLVIMGLAALTYHSFALLVPLEAPWLHTSLITPTFTVFLLMGPRARLASVMAVGLATWSSYGTAARLAGEWAYWPHAIGVFVLGLLFALVGGHWAWLLARRYFLTGLELERSRDRLRRQAAAAALREEHERRRIAADLHDRVAQDLGLARMRLGAAAAAEADAQRARDLEETRDLVAHSISETRRLMTDLSPPVLHELGISAGLEWLGRWAEHSHGLRCTPRITGPDAPLRPEVALFLFQAARELLTNVAKHGETTEVEITLRPGPYGGLELGVSDRGVGFDPDDTGPVDSAREGFGLFSIRDRAELLGGECRVEAEPGAGTRVTIRVPVR